MRREISDEQWRGIAMRTDRLARDDPAAALIRLRTVSVWRRSEQVVLRLFDESAPPGVRPGRGAVDGVEPLSELPQPCAVREPIACGEDARANLPLPESPKTLRSLISRHRHRRRGRRPGAQILRESLKEALGGSPVAIERGTFACRNVTHRCRPVTVLHDQELSIVDAADLARSGKDVCARCRRVQADTEQMLLAHVQDAIGNRNDFRPASPP